MLESPEDYEYTYSMMKDFAAQVHEYERRKDSGWFPLREFVWSHGGYNHLFTVWARPKQATIGGGTIGG